MSSRKEELSESPDQRSQADAGTQRARARSADAASSATSTAPRIRKDRTKRSPTAPTGPFHIPAHSGGRNPLANWDPMESGSDDEETERPKQGITPFPLESLKGKSEAEKNQIISDYKAQAQQELNEYSDRLAKYQRYEIRVRLDEYRRGLPVYCSDAIVMQAVREIIDT